MPRDSYSYTGGSGQRPFAITEPDGPRGQVRHVGYYGDSDEGSATGIQAKEPDRQTAARRSSRGGRARSTMRTEREEEQQPRGRSAQRSGARRGAQARRTTEKATPSARRTSGAETKTSRPKKSRRGFAAMSPEQQREIARKGGLTVSRNRRHMADIGRIGGEHSHGGRRAKR